jgi:hypothetical protein
MGGCIIGKFLDGGLDEKSHREGQNPGREVGRRPSSILVRHKEACQFWQGAIFDRVRILLAALC